MGHHPINKHERRMIGRKKARRRTRTQSIENESKLRNTTRLCSCVGCGNPRLFAKGDDKLTIQERKELMRDVTITADKSKTIIEPKVMPATIECGHCGGQMDFVSIEIGYTCRNEDCFLHFSVREEADA